MNKLITGILGCVVASCLIVGSAQADDPIVKCTKCLVKYCNDEVINCMNTPGCMEAAECAGSCQDEDCLRQCAQKTPDAAKVVFIKMVRCRMSFCSNQCPE